MDIASTLRAVADPVEHFLHRTAIHWLAKLPAEEASSFAHFSAILDSALLIFDALISIPATGPVEALLVVQSQPISRKQSSPTA